ncbi:TPA: hypothetical protein HA244_05880 [Candidatus Micrarchaeota archaeon]|nr:hypothetical protein [Candidatus Micrarchaeota archaeon]
MAKARVLKHSRAPANLEQLNESRFLGSLQPIVFHETQVHRLEAALRHGVLSPVEAKKRGFPYREQWPIGGYKDPNAVSVYRFPNVRPPSLGSWGGNVGIFARYGGSKLVEWGHPEYNIDKIEPHEVFALVVNTAELRAPVIMPQPSADSYDNALVMLTGAGHKFGNLLAEQKKRNIREDCNAYLRRLTGKKSPTALDYALALAKKYAVPVYDHQGKRLW